MKILVSHLHRVALGLCVEKRVKFRFQGLATRALELRVWLWKARHARSRCQKEMV